LLYQAISNNPHVCCVYIIKSVSVANIVFAAHKIESIMCIIIRIKYFSWSIKYSASIGSCSDFELFSVVISLSKKFDKYNIKPTNNTHVYKNTIKIEIRPKLSKLLYLTHLKIILHVAYVCKIWWQIFRKLNIFLLFLLPARCSIHSSYTALVP